MTAKPLIPRATAAAMSLDSPSVRKKATSLRPGIETLSKSCNTLGVGIILGKRLSTAEEWRGENISEAQEVSMRHPRTPLLPGEKVIKDGRANLQRGWEAVGGRLYLTNRRLIFEPHAFNVQREVAEIPLERVVGVRKCWTKFLNILPVFPNSIAVSTTDGTEYRLVVFGRQGWINAIEGQRR
jgi:hypothetical protein